MTPAQAQERALAKLGNAIRFAAMAQRMQARHVLDIRRAVDGVRCTDPNEGPSRGVLDADEIVAAIGLRKRAGHAPDKIHAGVFADVRAAVDKAEG